MFRFRSYSLLTPEEVAAELRVTSDTVLELIARREIRALLVVDSWRISSKSLACYIRRQMQQPTSGNWGARAYYRWALTVAAGTAIWIFGTAVLKAQTSSAPATTATLNYQGYLEENGQPREGAVRLTFSMTNATGKSLNWTETQDTALSVGRFSVQLGSKTSIDGLLAEPELFLQVSVQSLDASGQPVGTATQLVGQQLLSSVPYARRGPPGKDFRVARVIAEATAPATGNGGEVRFEGVGGSPSWTISNTSGRLRATASGTAENLFEIPSTLSTPAAMQLQSEANMELQAKGGTVHVSNLKGGAANLSVDGSVSVAGNVTVSGTLSTQCEYKTCTGGDWTTCDCPAGKYIQTGGCDSASSPFYYRASYPSSLTAWTCGGFNSTKTINIICCKQN